MCLHQMTVDLVLVKLSVGCTILGLYVNETGHHQATLPLLFSGSLPGHRGTKPRTRPFLFDYGTVQHNVLARTARTINMSPMSTISLLQAVVYHDMAVKTSSPGVQNGQNCQNGQNGTIMPSGRLQRRMRSLTEDSINGYRDQNRRHSADKANMTPTIYRLARFEKVSKRSKALG
jgi:hypothetical protein